MKSYPIRLEFNYAMWNEIMKRDSYTDGYFTKKLLRTENLQEKIDFCRKWDGIRLTLAEAEFNIEELKSFEFNGEEIIILNDDV